MPQKYKAIFTDLDGTAIPMSRFGEPSPRVIAAVKQAQQHAIISAATGRPFELCDTILQTLELKTPCIVNGGSQIVDPQTREVLWEQLITPTAMKKIAQACLPYIFEDDGGDARNQRNTFPCFTGSNRMVVLLSIEHAEALPFVERLRQIPDINVIVANSWNANKVDLHISHIGASKRHALEVLLGMLNLDAKDVIGIGDGANDFPLFEAVGFKVAMGNAAEELKQAADFIAPTVGEDGLASVIEKFILPD